MSQQYTVWLNGTEWVINSKPPLYDQPAHPSPDSTLVIIAGIVLVLCFIVPACLHCYRPSARHRFAAERTAEQDDEGLKEITKQIEMHIFRMSKTLHEQDFCINVNDDQCDAEQIRSSSVNPSEVDSEEDINESARGVFMDVLVAQSESNHSVRVQEARLFSCTCAICLITYNPGEKVVWSSNSKCKHLFHAECIEAWLMKLRQKDLLCPCCRQEFIVDIPLDSDPEMGVPS